MQQVGEWILKELGSGSWWVGIPAAIVLVILKARRLIEDFDWHRFRRPRELESAIRSEVLDGTSKKILTDLAHEEVFTKACGRRIDPAAREMIVKLNGLDGAKLTIRKLVAASDYLHIGAEGLPTIRITRGDRFEHAYNSFIGIFSLLGMAITPLLLGLVILGRAELKDLWGVGVWCLMSVGGFVFAVKEVRPYRIARSLEADLASVAGALRSQAVERQEDRHADPSPSNGAKTSRSAEHCDAITQPSIVI